MVTGKASARRYNFWLALLVIILLGFAFRLSVARYLPNDDDDDGRGYARMANNLLLRHVFSNDETEPYDPTMMRVPGYPLFLAAIYAIAGPDNNTAVRMVQAVVDTLTCALIAALAWLWMPDPRRKNRAALAAALIAAVCPFTVIYVATIMSETLTIFLMVAIAIAATLAFQSTTTRRAIIWWVIGGLLTGWSVLVRPDAGLAAAAVGLTLGAVGLFSRRAGAGADPAPRTFPGRFARVLLFGSIYSLAFVIVLVPWTIRNKRVFNVFQPLSPAHAEMPGEFVAFGYFRWVRTWIDDERYIDAAIWSLDDKEIKVESLPAKAFDSPEEKARVAALLDQYNHPPPEPGSDQPTAPAGPDIKTLPLPGATPALPGKAIANTAPQKGNANTAPPKGNANVPPKKGGANANANTDDDSAGDDSDDGNDNSTDDDSDDSSDDSADDDSASSDEHANVEMTPAIDAGFAQIAQERINRNRLRYYIWMPVKRGFSLWFGTHSQYWPFGGEMFPWSDLDRDAHQQYWLPLFALIVALYTIIGKLGGFVLLRVPEARRWALLVALLTIPRLVFFATLENPEPRYVVELFAFISVLGGIAFAYFWRLKGPAQDDAAKSPAAKNSPTS